MTKRLEGRRIAFLATDGVEQIELTAPIDAVREAGATAELVSIRHGQIQGFNHFDKADTFLVDRIAAEVSADDYDALVIPGGVANPDALRTDADAVRLTREFMDANKPVASICHGPWVLVEAGALRGRTVTSWPSLKTDIRNAGGDWVDKTVQVDQRLVTSRKPDDLPVFCEKVVEVFHDAMSQQLVDETSEESFPASDPPAWTASKIGKSTEGERGREMR